MNLAVRKSAYLPSLLHLSKLTSADHLVDTPGLIDGNHPAGRDELLGEISFQSIRRLLPLRFGKVYSRAALTFSQNGKYPRVA